MVDTVLTKRSDSSTAGGIDWAFTDLPQVQSDRETLSGSDIQPQIRIAAEKIAAIIDLPENWDSYGACKIDPDCAFFALDLLHQTVRRNTPVPNIVPTAEGGIQIEWHTEHATLELEVLSKTKVLLYYEGDSETTVEAELSSDFRQLTQLLTTLSAGI